MNLPQHPILRDFPTILADLRDESIFYHELCRASLMMVLWKKICRINPIVSHGFAFEQDESQHHR